jgi:hypothetical protein
MDRRIKNEGVHDWLGKRMYDQNWANHDEGEKDYVWQEANGVQEA